MAEQLNELNIQQLAESLDKSLAGISSQSDIEMLKRDWLSKDGTLRRLFGELKSVAPEEKPKIASKLNELKSKLEEFIAAKTSQFQTQQRQQSIEKEYLDLSLPSQLTGLGAIHPVTFVERKIAAILKPFGFVNILGPEVEKEYYCFDALNIPKHHPARDMQDTFYTDTGHVLRTHTTSVQARALEKGGLPVKVASFGRVYRNETEDASHQAMFHQFELVWIEEGLTLANLLGLISHILKGLYGKKRRVRFIPQYYPYTEPSIGPQIDCVICKAQGCSFCGGAGWVSVAGAGMVHRNVLKEFKYDADKVSGFAFGLGTARLASQLCGLPTLKMVYDNDLRISKQLRF